MRSYFLSVSQLLRKTPALKKCPFCGRELVPGPHTGLVSCDLCNEVGSWFPQHLSYLLIGDAGTGKSLILYQIADYYLHIAKPKVKCVFVTIDDLPSHTRQQASPYLMDIPDVESRGDLVFVDGYSALAGVKSTEKHSILNLNDLDAMTELLAHFAKEGYGAFFIDSIAPLSTMQSQDSLARGLTTLIASIKSAGGTLFLTAPSTLKEASIAQLHHIVDVLMQFRHSESFTAGMLKPMGLGRWVRGSIDLTGKGIPMREFRFFKARGRRVFEGWIPFLIGKSCALITFPDDATSLQQLKAEMDELEITAKA